MSTIVTTFSESEPSAIWTTYCDTNYSTALQTVQSTLSTAFYSTQLSTEQTFIATYSHAHRQSFQNPYSPTYEIANDAACYEAVFKAVSTTVHAANCHSAERTA